MERFLQPGRLSPVTSANSSTSAFAMADQASYAVEHTRQNSP